MRQSSHVRHHRVTGRFPSVLYSNRSRATAACLWRFVHYAGHSSTSYPPEYA